MTDIDLLPCPFCGGTEIYIGPMNRPSAWGYWEVGCNNDDCPLDVDSVKVEGGTLEKAAAAWNTRATDTNLAALQAEIEALLAKVEVLADDNARLREALQAIVDEVSDGLVPYSSDSYLPAHLVEQARAAMAKEDDRG